MLHSGRWGLVHCAVWRVSKPDTGAPSKMLCQNSIQLGGVAIPPVSCINNGQLCSRGSLPPPIMRLSSSQV